MQFISIQLVLFVIAITNVIAPRTVEIKEQTRIQSLRSLVRLLGNEQRNVWELSGQYQGDMTLTKNQRSLFGPTAKPKLHRTPPFRKWPRGIMPFMISRHFTKAEETFIRQKLHNLTTAFDGCIRFKDRRPGDDDYVLFTPERKGCFSAVGRIGGEQIINLERTNDKHKMCMDEQEIYHEIFHAFGMYHMHSSLDRDKYLTMDPENIEYGLKNCLPRRLTNNCIVL